MFEANYLRQKEGAKQDQLCMNLVYNVKFKVAYNKQVRNKRSDMLPCSAEIHRNRHGQAGFHEQQQAYVSAQQY